jgi:serine/threonine protein kinase
VEEYCEGPRSDLRKVLSDTGSLPLPPRVRLRVLADVASGMQYLHHRRVVHRDLKAPNVLLTTGLRAKVADFGLSRQLPETTARSFSSHSVPSHLSTTYRELHRTMTRKMNFGSWVAPEILDGQENYDLSSDVFGFGIILFETWTRLQPEAAPRVATEKYAHMNMGRVDLASAAAFFVDSCASGKRGGGDDSDAQRLSGGDFGGGVTPALAEAVAVLFKGCVAHTPADRLHFAQVSDTLKAMLADEQFEHTGAHSQSATSIDSSALASHASIHAVVDVVGIANAHEKSRSCILM